MTVCDTCGELAMNTLTICAACKADAERQYEAPEDDWEKDDEDDQAHADDDLYSDDDFLP